MKFINVRGNFYKKIENFENCGSRTELLDFDFEIENFF